MQLETNVPHNPVLPQQMHGDYAERGAQRFFESTTGWVQDYDLAAEERRGIFSGSEVLEILGANAAVTSGAAFITSSEPPEVPDKPFEADNAAVVMTWESSSAGYDNILHIHECDSNGTSRVLKGSLDAAGSVIVGIGADKYYTFTVSQGDFNHATPGGGDHTWYMWSSQNVDNYNHFTSDDGSIAVEDLCNTPEACPNPGDLTNDADFDDIIFSHEVITLDIDTDSDNDRDVDRSAGEDDEEDVAGTGINQVGKRIFVNKDDDNENGVADTEDDDDDYSANDNDFAAIVIDATDLDFSDLTGYKLYLIADPGLNIYADAQKKLLANATNPPGGSSGTGSDATDDVYWWTIGTDTFGDAARTLYVEGRQLSEADGDREIRWQLRKSDGTTIVARDTIEINVEEIVWPDNQNTGEDWQDGNTSGWKGFDVGEAWHMDKALIDYILTPGTKGYIETIHPDIDDPDTGGTQITWSSADGPDSVSKQSYADGFTMEFDFSFDTTRGDGTYGYVQAQGNDEKLSFVPNSGVKFGTATRPADDEANKDFEIAILDIQSMVGLAGGLGSITIDEDGVVSSGTYAEELLAMLMTAVRYGGDYTNMTADYCESGGEPDYPEILESQFDNRTDGTMEIDVTKTGATYTVIVTLNDTETYGATGLSITGLTNLTLQSHWGSGVRFSDMDITAK